MRPPAPPALFVRRAAASEWFGPGGPRQAGPHLRWRRILWALLYPPRGNRISPTLAGVLLIAVSLGIGLAAYNTANNILFITLSLLLSCLILSGLLSWANLREVTWRLHSEGPWRADQTQVVGLDIRNAKRMLPTYGLWFDLAAANWSGRRHLETRLDPGQTTRLEWTLRPDRRGPLTVTLSAVGSLFPFGFLRKNLATGISRDVLVWPSPVEYRRHQAGVNWRPARSQNQVNRPGHGGDLLALRPYVPGDSPRLVHWKASARLRDLFVRQFTVEGAEGFSLRLDPDATLWHRPEQFELAVRLAGTLAEDLFKLERLSSVTIGRDAPLMVRRLRDVESFLDRLATLEPAPLSTTAPVRKTAVGRRLLDLQPDGARGVVALLDGKPAASA